jgi:hypothetical protein
MRWRGFGGVHTDMVAVEGIKRCLAVAVSNLSRRDSKLGRGQELTLSKVSSHSRAEQADNFFLYLHTRDNGAKTSTASPSIDLQHLCHVVRVWPWQVFAQPQW